MMEKILLLRSSENSSLYEDGLKSIGYTSIFIPVLEFKFVNLKELFFKLKDHNSYCGVVITSQRAVEAIQECLNGSYAILEHWKTKPIFVVGETTGKILNCELNLNGCDYQPGNANALADYIIEQNKKSKFTKPLLFPCGNLKSETLPKKLCENSIEIECIDVYTTQMHCNFKDNILRLKEREGIPLNLVFFSPSGVGFTVPILKELCYNFDNAKIIAIGPSTGKKITNDGLNLFSIAVEPTPSAVCNCLL